MGEVLLNGRVPQDWELPAMERARQCERERDERVIAGLLTGETAVAPVPERPRPVSDLPLGLLP
jgi:hypothetical protein